VLSDARESTNRVKKGVIKELFSEIVVVFWEEIDIQCHVYDIEHRKRYGKSGKRKGKSEKPGQRQKKVIRNFGRENGFFS